eukprot:gene12148-14354_t
MDPLVEDFETWRDPDAFHLHVRQCRAHVAGPCVLDVNMNNILEFPGFSTFSIAKADLEACLPSKIVSTIETICGDHGIWSAFSVRKEMINFKKVLLHIMQDAFVLEKQLKRLCVFFFCDLVPTDEEPEDTEEQNRYRTLAGIFRRCKGALQVAFDSRNFTKLICGVHRHPDYELSAKLKEAPISLGISEHISRAAAFLEAHGVEPPCPPLEASPREVPEALEKCSFEALLASIAAQGWPTHITSFVRKVFIARGIAKVTVIRREVSLLRRATSALGPQIVALLEVLRSVHFDAEADVKDRVHLDMHIKTLTGALPAVAEFSRWLAAIDDVPSQTLFLAGDDPQQRLSSMFLPPDFALPSMFSETKALCEPYFLEMRTQLSGEAWPPPPATILGRRVLGSHSCRVCNVRFSKVWLDRGVCHRCEELRRGEGRCPYSDRCSPQTFCPHGHKCFVCDAWSCDECHLTHGDGEAVAQLVSRLNPAVIFLDFDRTLASTKNGGSPLQGRHSLDPELETLLRSHPNVHIVTRNPHEQDIREFLARHRVVKVPIHSVGKRSASEKADVLCRPDLLPQDGSAVGLFVDDNIQEHCVPRVRALGAALHRVLFVRGL